MDQSSFVFIVLSFPPLSQVQEEEASLIGLVEGGEEDSNRVVVNIPPGGGDRVGGEDYGVSKALLRRVGRYCLHTNLVDATVYVFKKWVLELIESREAFAEAM